jgi:protein O-mannosyl-transferase
MASGAAPSRSEPAARAHLWVSLATLVTFLRAVPYPLHPSWDDGRFILENADVRSPSWNALRSILSEPHFQAYHPLHLLSYWIDVPWVGANAAHLHATSLVLWMVAANVLLRVFAALGLGVAEAALATCACALHPAQVEAVSWATGRKDVLALLFSCVCVLAHLRSERFGDRHAWLARAAYLLAALSKTTALPLPVALWLADVTLRRKPLGRALLQQLPSLGLASALSFIVMQLWQREAMLRATAGDVTAAPARVLSTVAHQLGTALWPSATSPMYTTRISGTPPALSIAVAVALAIVTLVAWRNRSGRTVFALGGFLVFLSPVSNAVPMYFPFQDRYLSLPLVALGFGFGACVAAVERLVPRAGLALGFALVIALCLRCVQYQGEWRSEQRLWGHAASVQPDAFYAWMKLGEVRRDRGDLYGAIRAYRTLVRLDPRSKAGHTALLQAVALRDERLRSLRPSRARELAQQYYASLEDGDALRTLAAGMLSAGYVRAAELPLWRSLDLAPFPDAALEHAASVQFAEGRPGLALCYLRAMRAPTRKAELLSRAAEARRRMPFELP